MSLKYTVYPIISVRNLCVVLNMWTQIWVLTCPSQYLSDMKGKSKWSRTNENPYSPVGTVTVQLYGAIVLRQWQRQCSESSGSVIKFNSL